MKFQIGKAGIGEGTLASLALAFKNHRVIRVSVLRSVSPNRDKVQEIADNLVKGLEGNYRYIIVGFTIILKKMKDSTT